MTAALRRCPDCGAYKQVFRGKLLAHYSGIRPCPGSDKASRPVSPTGGH
jgi:hypothetical protein